jgi:hypothetical protein
MPQYQGVWTLEQQAQALTNQQWVTDPNFKNTTLLLQADGTGSGSQNNTFLDSSTNNFFITRNGNTTQGSFSPFSQAPGYWSNYLQGSSSGFSFTGINIGTSQFTFEGWVYVPSFGSIQHMYGGSSASDIAIEITNATTIVVDQSGVASQSFTVPAMATNAWHHIAVVRNASVMTAFVDGVRSSTGTLANTVNYNNFVYIGYKSSGFALTGYISNFRVVKAAVYDPTQTTIVVSTSPLTSIANTVLLTCQSNRFVDNGPNAVVLTPTNSPSVQAFGPFAPALQWTPDVVGGSGYFDGSGDYLTTPSSSNLAIGTSDFCIEWFYYQTNTATSATPFCQWGGGQNNWILQYNSSNFIFYYASSSISYSYTPVPNQWTHGCVCRSGSTMSLYLNGVRVNTKTDSSSIANTRGLVVGQNPDGGQDCTGYIAYPRLVVGSSVYTPSATTLTVPTAPLTAVSGTQFLAGMTNAGIYDGKMANNLETVGNAQVATSPVKYGSGSMYFPPTNGNYCVSPPNQPNLLFGTGNFTIEAWVYPISFTNSASGAFGYGLSGGYVDWNLEINTSGAVLYIDNDAGRFTSSSNLPANTWTHLCVVRTNTGVTMYFNGVSVGSYSTINNISGSSTSARLYVGTGAQVPGSRQFIGYIDDLRITKGVARYFTTFTPPQQALPRQ